MVKRDVPIWYPIATAVGGALIGVALGFARRQAKRIRDDGDPKNDWEADIIEAIDEAAREGNFDKVLDLTSKLRSAMPTK